MVVVEEVALREDDEESEVVELEAGRVGAGTAGVEVPLGGRSRRRSW